MQKSLLDCKHHQNEELEIQQELSCMTPWSSETLNPAPTTPSPHTLSRLVYLCCLCSGPKNVFTHLHSQILVSNTTFQKSHLLPETHTPTSWFSVVNILAIGLDGVTRQVVCILTRQVHPRLLQLCCCGWLTHLSWSSMIKGDFSEQGLSLRRCQQRVGPTYAPVVFFLLMN